MATTADFKKLDLFIFLNVREYPSDWFFRVAEVGKDYVHCRIPMPGTDGSEQRYSFSNEYLKDAEIVVVGKAEEPERDPVYTKPKKPKKFNTTGAWTPPIRKRGRRPKAK